MAVKGTWSKGVEDLIEAAKKVSKIPDRYGSTVERVEVQAKDLFELRAKLRAIGEDNA